MHVMGVDLSSKTGVAVVSEYQTLIHAAEYEFEGASGYERCGLLAQHIIDMVRSHKPALICIEAPITSAKFNNFAQIEIAVAVRFALWQENIPFVNVSPSSLKKFITGSGNCNKNVIMMTVYKQWGIECPTDNIADAVGLAMWGLCAAGIKFSPLKTKTVKEAIKKFPPVSMQLISQALLTN